jgi:hypothetical protein
LLEVWSVAVANMLSIHLNTFFLIDPKCFFRSKQSWYKLKSPSRSGGENVPVDTGVEANPPPGPFAVAPMPASSLPPPWPDFGRLPPSSCAGSWFPPGSGHDFEVEVSSEISPPSRHGCWGGGPSIATAPLPHVARAGRRKLESHPSAMGAEVEVSRLPRAAASLCVRHSARAGTLGEDSWGAILNFHAQYFRWILTYLSDVSSPDLASLVVIKCLLKNKSFRLESESHLQEREDELKMTVNQEA